MLCSKKRLFTFCPPICDLGVSYRFLFQFSLVVEVVFHTSWVLTTEKFRLTNKILYFISKVAVYSPSGVKQIILYFCSGSDFISIFWTFSFVVFTSSLM